jgi:hypothetical protein
MSQEGACAFLLHFWLLGGCGLLYQIGLTGFGNRPDRFVPSVGTCLGEDKYVQGGDLVCFGGL